jgi:2-polyprenyl-3-methyl-5-hydroxy-6-metoxy-1,4-benzoquinol methylase
LDKNHELKRKIVLPWIRDYVSGKRVLDLFCANGAFSFEAALAGAREVVGLEFSPDRANCAQFIARAFSRQTKYPAPTFLVGDVYKLTEIFRERFDVVMCFGGLYHIPDPPFVLTQIRALTQERLILQTSGILPKQGNWAKFIVREDARAKGLTSIVGGKGAWRFTENCFENMLRHAEFKVVEKRRPSIFVRKRFPWYCALAEPLK